MINRTLIENEIEVLIKEFEDAFPDSYVFKKHPSMKEKLISCIAILFNDQKVTSEYESEIHERIIKSLDIPMNKKEINKNSINETNEMVQHMKWLYAQWGDELGTLLLKVNRSIGKICCLASAEFDEKIRK